MNALTEIIRREIGQQGVLSFARFMELALYCPKHGYYETKKDNPGRRGDYYTSVGVGEIFGGLLACQFAEWLEPLRGVAGGGRIVEAGAHDGRLARDILVWLRSNRPDLSGEIEYWLIEPSVQRQEWQQETLRDFAPRVRWFSDLTELKSKTINSKLTGIFHSNELFDAMPIRRFGWDAAEKIWFEWGVAAAAEKFIWAKLPYTLDPQGAERAGARGVPENLPVSPELLAVLPDGYIIETCPAAETWWRTAAGILDHGKLMTIDYGLTAGELILPNRSHGSLRGFFRHHPSDDVLAHVGEQDLTAHVNFSVLQTAGESAGLKTEKLLTQSQFLTQILGKAAPVGAFGEWTSAQSRQFQTLTHPEFLGRAFRVLVQSK
ncbi:MAG: SAM-dependent methyltransferase [Verrucomicrobiia bacterium]